MKVLKAAVLAAFFSSTGHGFGIGFSKFALGPIVQAVTQSAKTNRSGSVDLGIHRTSLAKKSSGDQ